jgi:hypothetical protein
MTTQEMELHALRAKALREHFGPLLTDEENGGPSVKLSVGDWKDMKLFLQEPPTMEHNPGGPHHDSVLHDTADAIAKKDEARLILNLLLLYKAVRRA